jgi:RNA polymerase sigma-70 factor (ECF subfamily)
MAAAFRAPRRRLKNTLLRLDTPPPMLADILQELRMRLVEQQAPGPDQKVYIGRGSLIGWLRISAVRETNARRNRRARELPLETAPALIATPAHQPELALLLQTHKRELGEAFQQALASMSTRDRNVLRYHFVERLNIDQIGALYGVHRTTASRWIERARETLSTKTRAIFQERVSISNNEFQQVVMLIQSQVEVQLAAARA